MHLAKANRRAGDAAARRSDHSSGLICPLNSQTEPRAQAVRADLTGSDTCSAAGITVRAYAPVLALCRQLLAAGLNPDQAMEVFRASTLALRIRSIGEGAQLAVRDDNRGTPRFVAYRPGPDARAGGACGEAPPIAQNEIHDLRAAGGRR
jgi:hypothetical protein